MRTQFLLALVLVALAVGPAAVAAQETTSTEAPPTATEEPADRAEPDGADQIIEELRDRDSCAEPEAIDSRTVLCSATVKDGVAVLVLRSDRPQRITLTDSGAFMAGGEVPQKMATLRAEEPNTVRMDVTSYRGFSGVSIQTTRVLYAVPLERQTTLVGPPWGPSDVQLGAVTAALSVGSVSVVLVFRAVTGRRDSPERIA